jgi:hypothetical protein
LIKLTEKILRVTRWLFSPDACSTIGLISFVCSVISIVTLISAYNADAPTETQMFLAIMFIIGLIGVVFSAFLDATRGKVCPEL